MIENRVRIHKSLEKLNECNLISFYDMEQIRFKYNINNVSIAIIFYELYKT